jgi:hypothetical protein
MRPKQLLLLSVISVGFSSAMCFAQAGDDVAVSKELLATLLQKVDRLESRVEELEAYRKAAEPSTSVCNSSAANVPVMRTAVLPLPPDTHPSQAQSPPPPPSPPHAEPEPPQADTAMSERMDLGRTLLRIRGFGDVSFHGDTQSGDATSFSLGQLDLFITSDISDRFRFLSEIVFEGGPDNIYGQNVGEENTFGVDIERYLLQFSQSDYLNVSIGRGHTAIGYYNTAYHHSTWMQTTVDRPFLFEFEDRGGILPVHNVGATVSGMVPSGKLGLHYVAEIGNGRESRAPLDAEPVQNDISDQNRKAFNLAAFARPDFLRGLQAGVSVYRDVLVPVASPRIGEAIIAAHAILIRPKYEWLTEALMDRHALIGTTRVFHTPGFYSQVSKQFGAYRPYFRYEYLNAPASEPIFPDVGLRHGPLAGLRYDANESVALKFQYGRTFLRDQPSVNTLTGQIGFTF